MGLPHYSGGSGKPQPGRDCRVPPAEVASLGRSLPQAVAGTDQRLLPGGDQLAADNGRSTVIDDRFPVDGERFLLMHERFPEDDDHFLVDR